ncbi:MAG TPA: B12-binding domain-containing radical SAM protein [Oculatellaceae cyanobacterium]|jgi:radical SAM superfamily enzyme YgiQ (UPF0313 family)
MRVLLIYPLFPKSFWSFEKALALTGRKALLPPLGLVTVAAILPQQWKFKLVDRNVSQITEADWAWADLVILSAMIVQKEDFLFQIQEAKRRGKPVAVGGPYPTALPDEAKTAGADYLILDEGEITLPMFVEALERGENTGIFRSGGEKPDITQTPIPRFDLLEFSAYAQMSVQFSRGCPFQCEFCDIIVLYGRKPRTKTPAQLLDELERLYELGWRGSIFMVDDNFIGNKRNVKLLLKELKSWLIKYSYPFSFVTEASVDLAKDQELIDMMVECKFSAVFLGIETPDEESLTLTLKYQNTRDSLSEAVETITRSGLRVMAGFIIGFDGEKPGAGSRIVEFITQTAISTAFLSMLQALPDTALWHRLNKEGRLKSELGNINQTTLTNFVPTRPLEEIAHEYIEAFWKLYEPEYFLDRAYRQSIILAQAKYPSIRRTTKKKLTWPIRRPLLIILWHQGVIQKSRWQFWRNVYSLYRHHRGGLGRYLSFCSDLEHFMEYRQIVKQQIEAQL